MFSVIFIMNIHRYTFLNNNTIKKLLNVVVRRQAFIYIILVCIFLSRIFFCKRTKERRYILDMIKKDVIDGQKIYSSIRRKIHWLFSGVLIICFILITLAIIIDLFVNIKSTFYYFIAKILCSFGDDFYEIGRNIKHVISQNIRGFYDTLITITTILSAAVIFFYSVQDNKREGIPHRAILAYSFGSYTIPIFFFSSLFILTSGYWLFYFNMRVTFIVCMAVSYIFQMAIIVLILFSTSYSCGLRVICKAEIRQYKKLCKKNLGSNPQFIWTYLMHHLEQAVTSDELLADRMMLIRELLKTPYCEKEMSFFDRPKKCSKYVAGMSKVCMEKNDLGRIYEFYYGNLSAVMEYLNKVEKGSERNKIYLVLYEFLDNLKELYKKVSYEKEIDASSEAVENYMMTISGMVNAVLDSGTLDAEGFCNYVLNKCIADEIREKQIGLYLLFQEYLYRTFAEGEGDSGLVPVQCLKNIDGIGEWSMKPEYEKMYFDFWQIWMGWTTVSEINRRIYLKDAMDALRENKNSAGLISHIMFSLSRAERSTNENKSYSVDKKLL